MITKVRVHNFKQFEDEDFDLREHIILAGPNNSGKTTLLQAIKVWHLALQKWTAERGSGSQAKKRSGVPITRKDFTVLPLREMNLLWKDCSVSMKKDESEGKPGYPRVMKISVEGRTQAVPWELSFEFRYQSSEQIYVKPAQEHLESLPNALKEFGVVHVPPFSGIGAEETRYDRPYQDMLIGQGKAGDILRNLLLEIHKKEDKSSWTSFSREIETIFGYKLSAPEYEGKPFIFCEYIPGVPEGRGKEGLPRLDIASAGSGFHQVLLIFAFFYARPASVLLLDEPDAHLHIILQKQIYDRLRQIAADKDCQLIIATHSEVLINSTSPEMILSLYGKPHCLLHDIERQQVAEALKRLTAIDVLLSEQSPGILYVEGESDFNLLKAWAEVLKHPLYDWFMRKPFWHSMQGRQPKEARGHFFALQAMAQGIKAYMLLDGDNREIADHEVAADRLVIGRWRRYEAENYLIHPTALLRFAEHHTGPLFLKGAEDYLHDQLPPAVYRSPLDQHDYLESTPASKTLLPELFRKLDMQIGKNEYYLIAAQMKQDELCNEIKEKLDGIQQALMGNE
ncbi:MAG: AAA family ATPase [Nitrospiraceae bacterium]|nr:AAA family ATPase [Nitrospiraceae bacterium]